MPWTDWMIDELGFKVAGAPVVSSWQEGRLDVFIRSTDSRLYHRVFENNKWQGSNWEDLSDGHPIQVSPAAVSWGPNRIDLFAVWDKQVHHRAYQNGTWNPWTENLGGATNDAPAAASWKAERVDVLVHTTDNFMSRRYWESRVTSGWKDWENVGGMSTLFTLLSAPAAVTTGPHRIDCFGRGPADHLVHAWYQDSFQQPWVEIDILSFKDAPAVVSGATADRGRVDVFVRGADDLLKHRIYYAAMQAYQPAGDTIHTTVAGDYLLKIARQYNITLEQLQELNPQVKAPNYVIHPGEQLIVAHHDALPGRGDWEPGRLWENINVRPISGAPAAIGWWSLGVLKRIDCFAHDANHNLMHTWWT
jgi:FOG: LysM repeat